MSLPLRDQIPSELAGDDQCGPRAIWATLRHFGIDRTPEQIRAACGFISMMSDGTFNPIHGTYLIGVAVALKKCGLEVEWSADDPEPNPQSPVSIALMAEAKQLGIVPVRGVSTEELAARLDGRCVAIISHNYQPDGGPGHFTPTLEIRNGCAVFPLEKVNPTLDQLEGARTTRDQCREVVLAWASEERGF